MKKKTDQPGPTGAPEWASFFEGEGEYDRFNQHVRDYFSKKKVPISLSGGVVRPLADSPFGKPSPMGLQNLAQSCHEVPEEDWPRLIKGHFENMQKVLADKHKRDAMLPHFEKIMPFLAVRIFHADFAKDLEATGVCTHLAGDIYQVLVFDWPESISSIQRKDAEKWGLPDETLFQIGKENTRQKCPVRITDVATADGAPTFLCTSEHFFAGNILFDLENQPHLTGTKGALLGFPNRHAAIIAPFHGASSMVVLNAIIPATHQMNLDGPGSISNHLFWWTKDHGLVDLPLVFDGETVDFSPPAIFIECLDIAPDESL